MGPELLVFLAFFLLCSSSVSSGSIAATSALHNFRSCASSFSSSKDMWSGASWNSPVVALKELCSCRSFWSLAIATLLGRCVSFSRSRCPAQVSLLALIASAFFVEQLISWAGTNLILSFTAARTLVAKSVEKCTHKRITDCSR